MNRKCGCPHYAAQYDTKTLQWIEQRSDENMVLRTQNHLDKLSFQKAKHLRKYGIIELKNTKGGGTKYVLSEKAKEILDGRAPTSATPSLQDVDEIGFGRDIE